MYRHPASIFGLDSDNRHKLEHDEQQQLENPIGAPTHYVSLLALRYRDSPYQD
jgi:hypothetical protein